MNFLRFTIIFVSINLSCLDCEHLITTNLITPSYKKLSNDIENGVNGAASAYFMLYLTISDNSLLMNFSKDEQQFKSGYEYLRKNQFINEKYEINPYIACIFRKRITES